MMNLVLITIFAASMAHASEGVISYGGDEILRNFFGISNRISEEIDFIPKALLAQQDKALSQELKAKIKTAKIVVSPERLYWNDSEVTAINFPQEDPPRIVISKKRWEELFFGALGDAKARSIVLHELLPLTGRADASYKKSDYLLRLMELVRLGKNSESLLLSLKFGEVDFAEFVRESQSYFLESRPDYELINEFRKNIIIFRHYSIDDVKTLFRNYFQSMPLYYCGVVVIRGDINLLESESALLKKAVYQEGIYWQKNLCKNY